MNTLKTIQVLARIGKVLSKIVFILCIVGFCGCILGIVSLAVGFGSFKIGEVAIHSLIEDNAGMTTAAMYAAMATGLVACAAEAVLSKFAENYFTNELADGDPFTLRGAKELMRLGILGIAIPLGASIVSSIILAVADSVSSGIDKLQTGEFSSAGLGVMMIIASLLCRYGAERAEGKLPA